MNLEYLLKKAFERRAGLFKLEDTDCFRIVNGKADGLPGLAIDRFGQFLLVQSYDGRLLEKSEENIGLNKTYHNALVTALPNMPVEVKGIFLRSREKTPAPRESFLIGGVRPAADFTVRQNGMRLAPGLTEGRNQGIFLDMREIRNELAVFYKSAPPEKMLNLFCYTGIFSVHALVNGTAHAVNVDLSRSALERAEENYALNSLAVDKRDFIQADALEYARRLKKKGDEFQLIVIDPPTFSRNKKRSFSVRKNYRAAHELLGSLAPRGYVFSAVNTLGISREEYMSFHPCGWKLVFYGNESWDFLTPGSPYLKAGLWEVK
ncbi:MAG: class I SAM-dependent methyltransferase, partial [Spirochaetia bacterium]|nr:class I SAM-dependent methyltransferase [Spirochaetia bacterium]